MTGTTAVASVPVLVTRRLRLRELDDADTPALLAVTGRADVKAHCADNVPGHPAGWSQQRTAEFIAECFPHWQRHGYGLWALERRNRLVGYGGLYHEDWLLGLDPVPGLWLYLHPDHWRTGLAAEAARAALGWGFEQGMPSIVLAYADGNRASAGAIARVAIPYEQTLPYTSPVTGLVTDFHVHRLTRERWTALQQGDQP